MNEMGIAGWLFHRSILHDQTMKQLDMPGVCKSLGVETIELVSSFFPSQDTKYLNQLRAALHEHGVRVRSIAVDMGDIANPDEAIRRTDIEGLKQWFYIARAIGSAAIRVNSGAASPTDHLAIDRICDGYRELAAEAAHAEIYLLIENHGGASADPQNIQTFLDRVDSPWFRACPDTGNFIDGTWEEGMRIMAPRAYSCHVKVFSYNPDGVQSWTGRDGQSHSYNLKQSLQILKDAKYEAPLYIEAGASATEEDSARDAIRYVRDLWAAL
jgi:sugar phosphate isomerase/epimerase